jgi:hypothetical protein
MNDLDEDDAPQFPWPLWLSVVVLTIHGLALLVIFIWNSTTNNNQQSAFLSLLAFILLLSPPAYFLISSVRQVLRGRCHSLGFIVNTCGAIAFIILIPLLFLILDSGIPLLIKIIMFFEFMLFLVATIIAHQCESQWQSWKAERDKRRYEEIEAEN